MKKLITAIAALIICIVSHPSYSQDEAIENKATQSLDSKYQQELDKWMLQAYEGDKDAQFKVGVLFTNDQFEAPDLEQSAYWYKQAARQGHALAQYNLGHQFLTGNGVKRNEAEAMKWWLKAAEQDHPLAQFNIGRAYYLGIGLAEDHSQSQLWFRRAARNNEPKSIDILKQLGWATEGEFNGSSRSNDVAINDSVIEAAAKEPQTKEPVEPTLETTSETASEATTNTQNDGLDTVTMPNENSEIADSDSADKQELAANSNAAPEEALEETSGKASVAPTAATRPIAIYTNPNKRSVLIAILDIRQDLTEVSSNAEWTTVTNDSGFPVWVHQDYIVVADDIGTIQGSSVNARSVPLITNGTIVGQLNNGETLAVIDKKHAWFRVMSPSRFKAWVKTDEFNRGDAPQDSIADKPAGSDTDTQAASTQNDFETTSSSPINDNQWLFNQPADGYTLQLASLDDEAKVAEFTSRKKFLFNPDLHGFTSNINDRKWTYFLYGAYNSMEKAKQVRTDIDQKLAWIRSFGKLQQNRCVTWKQQIPTPKELNQYCS